MRRGFNQWMRTRGFLSGREGDLVVKENGADILLSGEVYKIGELRESADGGFETVIDEHMAFLNEDGLPNNNWWCIKCNAWALS